MTNGKITATRETLLNDAGTLKRDAAQIVDDVKNHAYAHVDAAKDTVNTVFDQARDYVKERPLHVAAAAFFIGFLIGTFRRK